MRKFKIYLTRDYFLSLSFPSLSRAEKMNSFVKILIFAGLLLLFLYLLLLPVWGYLGFSSSIETDYFRMLINFTIVIYIIYFLATLLSGKKRLNDPANFLNILLFALLTTTASVFVVPSSLSNTFGNSAMRSVSGIYIMCSIGLFYIINVFVKDKTLIKRSIYALTIGFLLLFKYLLLSSYGTNTLIANSIVDIAPLFILLVGVLFISKIPKTITSVVLILSLLLTIVSFSSYTGLMDNLYFIIASIALSSLVLSVFFIVVNKKYLTNRIKELQLKKNNELRTKLRLAVPLIVLATPVWMIIFGFIVQLITNQPFLNIYQSIYDITLGINNIFVNVSANSSQFVSVLFGLGGRILNPSFSLFGNIISSQGLVGIIAYLFLGITAFYFGFKLLKDRLFKNRDYKIVVLLLFIMLYSTFMSFFTYPGFLTVILWWIGFALLSAYSKADTDIKHVKDLVYSKLEKLQLVNNKLNLQLLIGVAIVLLGILFISFLGNIAF